MKMIHCADLHLDSKLSANLDKDRRKERRSEILRTYEKMVQYAVDNDVNAILIAGDMFDTKSISASVRNAVLHSIMSHSDIVFYYLNGNHDRDNFLSGLEEMPANLRLFQDTWTTYEQNGIVISGMELNSSNHDTAYISLVLDSSKFNIVMLHGQEVEGASKDKAEVINLKALRNKGIDYLALGHIHSYKKALLDARGIYCYPGCLEGRGFDECGEHGFVVLDVNEEEHSFTQEFIPFAQRELHTVQIDVSGCLATTEMVERIQEKLGQVRCKSNSMVKLVLTGELDVECEKDISYLLTKFKEDFYFVKVYDETTLKIQIEEYMMDESLKGEFVRMVMANDEFSEDEKAMIIRYGLQAIAGEEVQ